VDALETFCTTSRGSLFMQKITKPFVESIIPYAEKVLIFWDSDLKVFSVVVRQSGRLNYCFSVEIVSVCSNT